MVRELITADVFKMSRILSKMEINVEAETTEIVDGEAVKVKKSQEQVGAETILAIGENLYKAEKEVNEFMAGLIGVPTKDFAELPIGKVFDYFEEFKKLPGVEDFFKRAGRLSKLMP